MAALPWSAIAEGANLVVRLTPKGGRDAIDGIETMSDGRTVLKVRVQAAPSEGQANATLLKLVARVVGVPPRHVSLVAGATARIKRLKISGDGQRLSQRWRKSRQRAKAFAAGQPDHDCAYN